MSPYSSEVIDAAQSFDLNTGDRNFWYKFVLLSSKKISVFIYSFYVSYGLDYESEIGLWRLASEIRFLSDFPCSSKCSEKILNCKNCSAISECLRHTSSKYIWFTAYKYYIHCTYNIYICNYVYILYMHII